MGRKIPAKKHRGVKDPLVQQAKRLQCLKKKINAPPKDPDEQPVPRSLERLFAFKTELSTRERKTSRKGTRNKEINERGVGRNPISQLLKLPGESARSFSLRINSAVRALHGDVTQHDYPQDMEEEDRRGTRMADLREKRARKQRRAANMDGRSLPTAASVTPKLTRTQKLALKKKAKKAQAEESVRERAPAQYERVPFGEVTHAPPALRPPRGVASSRDGLAPRPGRRTLLLTALLHAGGGEDRTAHKSTPPPAEALRKERARLDAIRAYRDLKSNKLKTNKVS